MGRIKRIEFGILSPKLIKDMAVVKIRQSELYDADGYPIDSGLCDLRLGVVDPGLRCRTCGGRIGECLGHFGYLELTKPVIHPLLAKKIYMILRSTCQFCHKPLADKKLIKLMKKPVLEIYRKNIAQCPHCGKKQKEIKYQKPTTFLEGKKELTAEEVRERLEAISDEDLELLRLKIRPEWLVLTILPIPPVTVRPSITLETGERSEDDLTHKLVDVVRINERFRKNLELGAPDFIVSDIWELLQYHISTYIDNEISALPAARHRSGRPLKTLAQRLGKKRGRFRGNLTGKRVNFSARTVISPDPMISLNEVGVPECIAKELTIPIFATNNNIDELKKYVLNGPNKHPGANYVIRPDGVRKKITDENKEEIAEEISFGYIVERHIKDGDIALFNRQPSLHRISIMAHKVRVMPYRTFRMNLTVTIPYNADFDGDEMNLHIPQTTEARVEAELLMLAEKHIKSPRYGLPIITCKQDHITGCYLLTTSSRISKKDAYEILMNVNQEYVEKLLEKDYYTGKEIFSALLPEIDITFISATGEEVIIKKGKLIKGVIDEEALGEKKGKIIDEIMSKYGTKRAAQFLDDVSRLSLEVISKKGFSISLSDMDIPEKAEHEIKKVLELMKEKTNTYLKLYKQNKITINDVETRIQQFASEATIEAGRIIKKYLPDTSAVIMAKTGARGSYVNISQMCGFVGQETIEGQRIQRGYLYRILPHFKRFDIGLKARGFVFNGYKYGLDPFEFFFDAMNSRENLMDKSLHTRHSGYMERRLVTALYDLTVKHDMTVRDSENNVIQFKVGEDGIDPMKSDAGKLEVGET